VCKPDVVAEALRAARGKAPCASERIATLVGGVAASWDALLANPQRDRFLARLMAVTGQAKGKAA
jgi:beta-N-acetylhexosaminidase